MKKNIIKVEGMVCGGCEKRVENVLSTLEGINKVKANTITVEQTRNTLFMITTPFDNIPSILYQFYNQHARWNCKLTIVYVKKKSTYLVYSTVFLYNDGKEPKRV